MNRLGLCVLAMLVAAPAAAADVLAPANTEEVPSFQRHVVLLLGRLGYNGRACHGSFQGQGGFQRLFEGKIVATVPAGG